MMLLFKFQRTHPSFTDFNRDFIKDLALNLSRNPTARETNKDKQIEKDRNQKCPAKMMFRPNP